MTLLSAFPLLLVPLSFGLAWLLSRRRTKRYDPCSDNECLKGR